MSALAGIDKPWQEDTTGGGTLPEASLLFGSIGAAYLVYQGVKERSSLGNLALAAVLGFSFGALLGFPVACAMK